MLFDLGLVKGVVSATGMGFTWDDNGNLLTWDDGVDDWTYRYGPEDRLINVGKNGGFSAHYTYDAGGRRVRSLDGGGVTDYLYSGLNVIDEVSGGAHEKHYYAAGMHITSNSGGTIEYYHVDHLGSTRLKTDGAGDVVYESNYEPYGPGSGEEGSEDYRYTGKQEDPTGLYYFGARYYDPVTGRFTTRDNMFGDLTDPQSLNRYVYCRNNPQKYIDPDGHIFILGTFIVLSVAGGVFGYNAYAIWNHLGRNNGDISSAGQTFDWYEAGLCFGVGAAIFGGGYLGYSYLTANPGVLEQVYQEALRRAGDRGRDFVNAVKQFRSYRNGREYMFNDNTIAHILGSDRPGDFGRMSQVMNDWGLSTYQEGLDLLDDAIRYGQYLGG